MAAIVDRLKKQIAAQGGSTAGVRTISQAINCWEQRYKNQ